MILTENFSAWWDFFYVSHLYNNKNAVRSKNYQCFLSQITIYNFPTWPKSPCRKRFWPNVYQSHSATLILASNFWAKLTWNFCEIWYYLYLRLRLFFLNIWHEICRNLKLKGLAEIPCQNGKGDWKNHRCHSWPKVPQGHPKLLKLRRNTVPLKVLTPKYTQGVQNSEQIKHTKKKSPLSLLLCF